MNPPIDISPEVRTLKDGTLGYFYSIHQLEVMRDMKLQQMTYAEAASLGGRSNGSPFLRESNIYKGNGRHMHD